MSRHFPLPHTGPSALHLLGNETCALHVSSDGSRALTWRGKAINRWRAGRVPSGSDMLLRDVDSGELFSTSGQLYGEDAVHGDTYFEPGRVRFERRFEGLSSTLDCAVDPHHGGEMIRLDIHNTGTMTRHLDALSTMELVLGDARNDASHPAFSKMFIVTETRDDGHVLLARRRPDSNDQPTLWAAQGFRIDGVRPEAISHETDRAALLGRDRDLRDAAIFETDMADAGHVGTVLDPVFCRRFRFRLAPNAHAGITIRTLAGHDDNAVLKALATALDENAGDTLDAAANATKAAWRACDLDEDDADATLALASAVVHADNHWRADVGTRLRGKGGQQALWPYAISGDRPIVCLRIANADAIGLLHELLNAQALWLAHQLAADLVVVHEAAASEAVHEEVAMHGPGDDAGVQVFILDADKLDDTARDTIASASAAILDGRSGHLSTQVAQRVTADVQIPRSLPARVPNPRPRPLPPIAEGFAGNGLGAFTHAGNAYVTELGDGRHTPAPWVNVMANADFGCIVSTAGSGSAWAINSQKNLILPWRNDPVSDTPTDAIYLRDVDSGTLWCPTPGPIRDELPCRVTHAPGHTRFVRHAHGIDSELTHFVVADAPVRISRLRMHNQDEKTRHLDLAAYVEWALQAVGDDGRAYTQCWRDDDTGALFARNAWRKNFGARVAFFALASPADSFTCDREDFFGAQLDMARPAALATPPVLGGCHGIGIDPCAALAKRVTLEAGKHAEIILLLGQGKDEDEARELVTRYRRTDVDAALQTVRTQWETTCGTVQVETPDHHADAMINHWLPYQVLSCRVWARTAYYQCSGGYGFRDQLQDVMALCLSRPDVARQHILRAASRQFPEGDVQHWWLPPDGAGVRTRIVDDRVWLPCVAAHYVRTTGDRAILDETVSFLDAPPLDDDQVDSFTVPGAGKQSASLFEHCVRALEVSLDTGSHDLPLFGRGDWNDGMNRVGKDGRGESVWMAWFLIATIKAFAPFAEARGEKQTAQRWRKHAQALADACETHAWDGDWWTRGWYDNGHPLGVAADRECRIDTIAQSWSVLSGAADPARAMRAMASVDKLAVRRDADLIALFTPAFDVSTEDPGYIKGYPPGLRENGGQYTHGVIWSAIAFAELGDGDKAGELLAMLNPVNHADSAEKIARYKTEPYVSCGDVYTADGHLGRGGWSWYSGSAGWLYRAIVEWQLGLHVEGDRLRIQPCIPSTWPGYRMTLKRGGTTYVIDVGNPKGVCHGVTSMTLDDASCEKPEHGIALVDDGTTHQVHVMMG